MAHRSGEQEQEQNEERARYLAEQEQEQEQEQKRERNPSKNQIMDYYRVLGISRDASKEEVKAAFRRLALRFHPDRQPSDASQSQRDAAASRFRQASEAYNVLGDAAKRLIYNREGRAGLHSEYYSRNSRQQHQRPYYRSGATPPRSTAWNFRVSLSPLDIAFHAVLAG